MLKAQKLKIINSWAIRFNLFCYNNNLLSLAPRYSMIQNNGNLKEATHISIRSLFVKNKIVLNYKSTVKKPKMNLYFNKYVKFSNFISIRLLLKIFLKKYIY